MDQTTIFIAITGAAVLLQAGLLLGIFLAMRKSTNRMEAIATELKGKVLPVVDEVQAVLAEVRPQLRTIAQNLEETSIIVRGQVERTQAAVNDAVDRARLQVIRGDELLTRTLDRVEQTSELVHKTVVSPVRQVSGLMQGLTVGLEFLFSRQHRRNGSGRDERRPVPQDEMFI